MSFDAKRAPFDARRVLFDVLHASLHDCMLVVYLLISGIPFSSRRVPFDAGRVPLDARRVPYNARHRHVPFISCCVSSLCPLPWRYGDIQQHLNRKSLATFTTRP